MKKTNSKRSKNLIWIIGALIIILVIVIFSMTKLIKSDCEKAVAEYLKTSETFQVQETSVTNGNTISVDYIGRLKDGTVFDTSVESVAKSCGNYQTGRDYTQGLSFQVGAGQMIPGFDAGVVGMKIGETKTINIPYMQAYGARDEKKLLKMAMTDEFKAYKKGDSLMTMYGPITVNESSDTEIVFDTNHTLAGKDLIFDISIKEIK